MTTTTTMTTTALARRPFARSFEVLCTVRVCNSMEELGAHVELPAEIDVGPGDQVLVHGEPIHPPFGQTVVQRRRATVTRATWLGRLWTRLTGDLGCLELLDVSFTDRRTL
ncbi:MAG: hypothetical protein AAGF11_46020 [Myxococcota bacterium]